MRSVGGGTLAHPTISAAPSATAYVEIFFIIFPPLVIRRLSAAGTAGLYAGAHILIAADTALAGEPEWGLARGGKIRRHDRAHRRKARRTGARACDGIGARLRREHVLHHGTEALGRRISIAQGDEVLLRELHLE